MHPMLRGPSLHGKGVAKKANTWIDPSDPSNRYLSKKVSIEGKESQARPDTTPGGDLDVPAIDIYPR